MKKIVDVQTGQVKFGVGKIVLQSKAIGSCVVIVAYDSTKSIGVLAHIMLPGAAPAKDKVVKMKYASNAIDTIVNEIGKMGLKKSDIEIALVGAANVLRREDDTICRDNIASITELLAKKQLKVKAKVLGGTARRSVYLDVEHGIVSYTEGDGSEKQLLPV